MQTYIISSLNHTHSKHPSKNDIRHWRPITNNPSSRPCLKLSIPPLIAAIPLEIVVREKCQSDVNFRPYLGPVDTLIPQNKGDEAGLITRRVFCTSVMDYCGTSSNHRRIERTFRLKVQIGQLTGLTLDVTSMYGAGLHYGQCVSYVQLPSVIDKLLDINKLRRVPLTAFKWTIPRGIHGLVRQELWYFSAQGYAAVALIILRRLTLQTDLATGFIRPHLNV